MKRKIKVDEHSAYVVVNDAVQRPMPSKWIFGEGCPAHIQKGPIAHNGQWLWVTGATAHGDGETVDVKNVPYTPYVIVGGELWTTHGQVSKFDRDGNRTTVPTEKLWAGVPTLYVGED